MDVLPNDLEILRSVIYSNNQREILKSAHEYSIVHGHGFWVIWELKDIDIAYV